MKKKALGEGRSGKRRRPPRSARREGRTAVRTALPSPRGPMGRAPARRATNQRPAAERLGAPSNSAWGRGLPLATAAPNRGLQLASSRRSSIGPPAGGIVANHNAPFQSAGARRGRIATTSVRMTRLQTAGCYWPAGGTVLLVLRRAALWPIRMRRSDPWQGIKPGGGGGGVALSVSIASYVGSRQAGGQSPR